MGSDSILRKLVNFFFQGERLSLFSPFGQRYNQTTHFIRDDDPEIATLREISSVLIELGRDGCGIDFLLMHADTYGIEINGRSAEFVLEYFKKLEEAAYRELPRNINLQVRPWSRIREEYSVRYSELRREAEQNFQKYVSPEEFQRAVQVAKFFNPGAPVDSAKKYCLERVVEANLVQENFDPIKLSLVRKEKDALDGPLDRVYLIENRAPWLGGK